MRSSKTVVVSNVHADAPRSHLDGDSFKNYEMGLLSLAHRGPITISTACIFLPLNNATFPGGGAGIGNRFACCHKDDAKVVLAISPAAFDGMWTVMHIVIKILPFHPPNSDHYKGSCREQKGM